MLKKGEASLSLNVQTEEKKLKKKLITLRPQRETGEGIALSNF